MTHTRLPLAQGILLAGCAAVAGACGSDEPEPGQLMVVVTTDMAVPTDIDTLSWSVTLAGESESFANGTLELAASDSLPATLAVRGGADTKEAVTIRVEGWQRGVGDVLRVAREAEVAVPSDRVAELAMPLTWLCSDANPLECPEGQTCEAGACVDSTVAVSSLPDYEVPTAESCLDVTACFGEQTRRELPRPGRSGACTIVGAQPLGGDGNVNVALLIDNARVGNYGFCGPFPECFILLPQSEAPGGWQISNAGEEPEIRLPDGVCDGIRRGSIASVVITKTAPSCPIYRPGKPLCEPPEETCLPAPICPEEWGDAWPGYVCSGSASLPEEHPEIEACWTPPASADGETTAPNGRWCCTTGIEPSSDPLLIDDMSGGPKVKITPPEGKNAGRWWTTLGEGSGSLEPGLPPTLFTYRTIDPPVTLPDGSEIKTAACLRSTGFSGYVAMQGFNFIEDKDIYGPQPLDVGKYSGISFWGWAEEPFEHAPLSIAVSFSNVDTEWGDRNAACWTPEYQSKTCDQFHKDVSLTSKWEQHFVRWEELHQSYGEWSPPQTRFESFNTLVNSTTFSVRGSSPGIMSQPFDFCIAHIYFTE